MAGKRGEPERLRFYVDGETLNRENYVREVFRLAREYGKPGEVLEVDVMHQEHCRFFYDGICDCRPRVYPAGRPEWAVRRAYRA